MVFTAPLPCGRQLLLLPCPGGRNRGSERSDPGLGLWEEEVAEHKISASSLCLHIHLFPEDHGWLRVHDLRIVSLSCFEGFCP